MALVAALRSGIEALIRTDTGSGGLHNTSSAAYLRGGLFYEGKPDVPGHPHIVYTVDGDNANASALEVQRCVVRFNIEVERPRVPLSYDAAGTVETNHTFGHQNVAGGIEPIADRLRARLQGVTPSDGTGGGWTFSPLDRLEGDSGRVRDSGGTYTRQVEVYACVASRSLLAPASASGVQTGTGIALSGTVNGGAFAVRSPFAFAYQQSSRLVNKTRAYDRFDRFTHETASATMAISFLNLTSAGTPVIPVGVLSALTLTLSPSVTWAVASGGYAHVESMQYGAQRMGGAAQGQYLIRFSGPTNPLYAPNPYVIEA